MNKSWNNKKIIEEVKNNGYYVFKNYFSSQNLKKIKKTLLDTLNYIKPGNEHDLQKKQFIRKSFDGTF